MAPGSVQALKNGMPPYTPKEKGHLSPLLIPSVTLLKPAPTSGFKTPVSTLLSHNIDLFLQTLCPDSDMLKQWVQQPINRTQVQEMKVTLGVLMPPWERRMFLHIHIDTNVPLSVTRDFVALLQKNSPGLN